MIKHVSNKIQNEIQMELFKAKESIKIAVAWFTNELLLQPLILQLKNGVSVELIINDDEINRGGESSLDFSEYLKAGGILRWNDSKQLMHEKFCIIDNRIVINGSYNWTNKAELNSEVESIFYDEEETTLFYNKLYKSLSERFEKESIVAEKKEIKVTETKDVIKKEDFYIDSYGAKYSRDRKRLIKGPSKWISSYHILDGVTIIEDDAFYKSSIKSIYIPDSVKCIGKSAFVHCHYLKSIHFPNSVTNIGEHSFVCCDHLEFVHFPDHITNIGDEVFKCCDRLNSIIIPSNITSIGKRAFAFTGLRSINIPESVTSIGEGAFDNTWMKTIYIPFGTKQKVEKMFSRWKWDNEYVEYYVIEELFQNVTEDDLKDAWTDEFGVKYSQDRKRLLKAPSEGMSNYSIKSGTKVICKNAFRDCHDLTSIKIPDSVTCIGDWAFGFLKKLKTVKIPNSVTYIGNASFLRCKNLINIRIPSKIIFIGNLAFYDCKAITSLAIPGSIKKIDQRSIHGCDNLTAIYIPAGTKSKFEVLLPNSKDILVES